MNLKELMEKDRRVMEECYGRGNLAVFSETHSPDMVVHAPPLPDTRGQEANIQVVVTIRQGFSDIKMEWGDSVCENDTIAQQFAIRMKHIGFNPMFPVPPSGKEAEIRGSVFLHVKNGKIVEEFQFLDLLGFMQQIGMVPPMGQK